MSVGKNKPLTLFITGCGVDTKRIFSLVDYLIESTKLEELAIFGMGPYKQWKSVDLVQFLVRTIHNTKGIKPHIELFTYAELPLDKFIELPKIDIAALSFLVRPKGYLQLWKAVQPIIYSEGRVLIYGCQPGEPGAALVESLGKTGRHNVFLNSELGCASVRRTIYQGYYNGT